MPRLENAQFVETSIGVKLLGQVYEDPRFPDGHRILTSPVKTWSPARILLHPCAITHTGTRYDIKSWSFPWLVEQWNQGKVLEDYLGGVEHLC